MLTGNLILKDRGHEHDLQHTNGLEAKPGPVLNILECDVVA